MFKQLNLRPHVLILCQNYWDIALAISTHFELPLAKNYVHITAFLPIPHKALFLATTKKPLRQDSS